MLGRVERRTESFSWMSVLFGKRHEKVEQYTRKDQKTSSVSEWSGGGRFDDWPRNDLYVMEVILGETSSVNANNFEAILGRLVGKNPKENDSKSLCSSSLNFEASSSLDYMLRSDVCSNQGGSDDNDVSNNTESLEYPKLSITYDNVAPTSPPYEQRKRRLSEETDLRIRILKLQEEALLEEAEIRRLKKQRLLNDLTSQEETVDLCLNLFKKILTRQ